MSSNDLDYLRLCASKLRSKEVKEKKKIKALQALMSCDVTVEQLHQSGIGKAVNKLSQESGEIKILASNLIKKWKELIQLYCNEKNEDETNKAESDKNETTEDENKMSIIQSISSHSSTKGNKRKHSEANSENNCHKRKNLGKSTPEINNTESSDKESYKIKNSVVGNSMDSSIDVHLNNFNFDDMLPKFPKDVQNCSPDEMKSFNEYSKEDSNVTSRYESQRRIWVPKAKHTIDNTDDKETICGVSVSEISTYDWKKLKSFENNSKKIMKNTEQFWEKLFKNNHKTAKKNDEETWRNAYLRAEEEREAKFLNLTAKLNAKNRTLMNAQPQAKVLKGPVPMLNKRHRK